MKLSELTNRELKNILRVNKIKYYSKLNKKDLVKKVNELIFNQNGGKKSGKRKNKKYTLIELIGGDPVDLANNTAVAARNNTAVAAINNSVVTTENNADRKKAAENNAVVAAAISENNEEVIAGNEKIKSNNENVSGNLKVNNKNDCGSCTVQ